VYNTVWSVKRQLPGYPTDADYVQSISRHLEKGMNRIHLALERSFGMGWDRKEGKGKEHSDGVLDFAFSSLGRSSLRPFAGKTQTKDF
jgi:hypothetical protein